MKTNIASELTPFQEMIEISHRYKVTLSDVLAKRDGYGVLWKCCSLIVAVLLLIGMVSLAFNPYGHILMLAIVLAGGTLAFMLMTYYLKYRFDPEERDLYYLCMECESYFTTIVWAETEKGRNPELRLKDIGPMNWLLERFEASVDSILKSTEKEEDQGDDHDEADEGYEEWLNRLISEIVGRLGLYGTRDIVGETFDETIRLRAGSFYTRIFHERRDAAA